MKEHTTTVCKACESGYEAHTEKTDQCTVCTRYKAIVSNAGRVRRDGRAPGCEMTLGEFAEWVRENERACEYCQIDEVSLPLLGMKTQVGLPLQRLGVDRVRDGEGYHTGNIVWCCFGCNKAKSNTFSHEEMLVVGRGIREAWEKRLKNTSPR